MNNNPNVLLFHYFLPHLFCLNSRKYNVSALSCHNILSDFKNQYRMSDELFYSLCYKSSKWCVNNYNPISSRYASSGKENGSFRIGQLIFNQHFMLFRQFTVFRWGVKITDKMFSSFKKQYHWRLKTSILFSTFFSRIKYIDSRLDASCILITNKSRYHSWWDSIFVLCSGFFAFYLTNERLIKNSYLFHLWTEIFTML